ncbi:KilA-N domain-containing protein [Shewanella sp. 30m-9]
MKTIQLTFNQVTATITSNEDGMFDLNDIWRSFGLTEKQRPSEWRHRVRKELSETGNMRVQRDGRNGQYTWATQEALYAYAMWCDTKFYMAVVQAFIALTNGDIPKAISIARSVADVQGERASELYGKCCKGGFAMRTALESLDHDMAAMKDLIDEVASTLLIKKARDAYWTSVIRLVEELHDEFAKTNGRRMDLRTYEGYTDLTLHCIKRQKRIVQTRLTRLQNSI